MAPTLRRFALMVSLSLLGAPAFAAPRAQATPETSLARGIVLRVLHVLTPFLEKLGTGIDSLGAPEPQPVDPASSATPQESPGDLEAGMDPLG
jgi:hypothetical protein